MQKDCSEFNFRQSFHISDFYCRLSFRIYATFPRLNLFCAYPHCVFRNYHRWYNNKSRCLNFSSLSIGCIRSRFLSIHSLLALKRNSGYGKTDLPENAHFLRIRSFLLRKMHGQSVKSLKNLPVSLMHPSRGCNYAKEYYCRIATVHCEYAGSYNYSYLFCGIQTGDCWLRLQTGYHKFLSRLQGFQQRYSDFYRLLSNVRG